MLGELRARIPQLVLAVVLLIGMPSQVNAQVVPANPTATDELVAKLKPKITGSLSATGTTYTVSGIDERRNPFTWMLNGNVTATIGELSLPFSAVVSERNRSFQQPFNQFGLSPKYKWATGHVGYRSITFSPYTLGGARFLGAGVELNPGKLRLGAMYGRFRKGVADDTTSTQRVIPAYKRTGMGLKLGVGTESNHVDLIFFRAADDTTSVPLIPNARNILPEENAAVGLKTKFKISRYLTFDGELAASAYNRDTRAEVLDWADDLPSFVRTVFTPRSSFIFQTATRLAVSTRLKDVQVTAGYTRVGPDYRSLGSYYSETDVQNITIAPSFSLMKRRIRVQLSGGTQRNNLDGKQLTTTKRLIGSASLSFRIGKSFNLSTQFNNYSTGQGSGSELLVDTLQAENVSRMIRVMPRYTVRTSTMAHSFSVGYSRQGFTQRNLFTDESTEANREAINGNYGLSFTGSGTSMRLSYNYSNNESGFRNTKLTGANVSVTSDFLEESLFVNASFGFINRILDEAKARSLTGNLGLSYTITKSDVVSLDATYGNNPLSILDPDRFTELITTFSYRRRFGR